ncbi:MAG: type II secretion system GspH family protein [Cyanobacteria bacterium]|nr:type II secretion system GspH family protein [Cyanobacteriota bacterium]
MSSLSSARGFTLFETLVATGILVTTLAGVAQLFVLGSHLTRQAGVSGTALIAAQQRLELLRGQAFTYDPSGLTVTDPALEPSPESSLSEDLDPYVDWLDADGELTDDADEAVLSRRWRITSLGTTTPDAIAIEVCVFRFDAGAPDACLATVRTRQP